MNKEEYFQYLDSQPELNTELEAILNHIETMKKEADYYMEKARSEAEQNTTIQKSMRQLGEKEAEKQIAEMRRQWEAWK